jgi:hypothetical protein
MIVETTTAHARASRDLRYLLRASNPRVAAHLPFLV